MCKIKKINNSIKTYLHSFKNIKLLSKVFIYDFLLVLSLYFTFILSKMIVAPAIQSLSSINLDSITEKSLEELQSAACTMKHFFIVLILTAIGAFLITVIFYSLTQGLAWNEILKKKLKITPLLKFSLVNLLWFTISAAIISIFIIGSNQAAFKITMIILSAMLLYLSMLLAYLFAKNPKFSQLKQTFKIGILKIHHVIIPLALIAITIFIAGALLRLYEKTIDCQTAYLSILISILLFSWVKIYFKEIIHNI
ncbi:MAG: hypothetical protein KKC75_08240 [Nanoarchaeota archaeon]|nr:hypothetical protein [Nanoarchaeota archaeon]MBU1946274.1 hypothetical protein [Nanoarchaeota archaeon]